MQIDTQDVVMCKNLHLQSLVKITILNLSKKKEISLLTYLVTFPFGTVSTKVGRPLKILSGTPITKHGDRGNLVCLYYKAIQSGKSSTRHSGLYGKRYHTSLFLYKKGKNMAKGGTGANTGTIISTRTKQRAAIDYSKARRKKKKADRCKNCHWNENGFCRRFKAWCSTVSHGGCTNFAPKEEQE